MSPITLRRRSTMKGEQPTPKETVINNTELSLKEVRSLHHYGGFMNEWRSRYVDVYKPTFEFLQNHPETVISVGHNFPTNTTWICIEPFDAYSGRITNADWRPYR